MPIEPDVEVIQRNKRSGDVRLCERANGAVSDLSQRGIKKGGMQRAHERGVRLLHFEQREVDALERVLGGLRARIMSAQWSRRGAVHLSKMSGLCASLRLLMVLAEVNDLVQRHIPDAIVPIIFPESGLI